MTTKDITKVMVHTPYGIRFHGTVKEIDGKKVFWRDVDYFKDRMRIFDAFSIHPDALAGITKMGVEKIIYHDKKDGKFYTLTVKSLNDMLVGLKEDDGGRKMAWKAKFSGGDTVYIKLDAFKIMEEAKTA